jgi:hypothetical protein
MMGPQSFRTLATHEPTKQTAPQRRHGKPSATRQRGSSETSSSRGLGTRVIAVALRRPGTGTANGGGSTARPPDGRELGSHPLRYRHPRPRRFARAVVDGAGESKTLALPQSPVSAPGTGLIHEPAGAVSFGGLPLGSSCDDTLDLVPHGLEVAQAGPERTLQVRQRVEQTVVRRTPT